MKKLKLTRFTAVLTGVLIAIPLIVGGLLSYFGVISRASYSAPKDLTISSITTSTAVITWTTDSESQGIIEYGTTPARMDQVTIEPGATTNHKVELVFLSPATTYHFVVRVGDSVYDNGGVPWSFTTKASTKDKEATPSAGFATVPEATSSAPLTPTVTPGEDSGEDDENTPNGTRSAALNPTRSPNGPSVIPTPSGTPTPRTNCNTLDCSRILMNLGPGKCTSADYQRCLRRNVTPSPTPDVTATPTISPSPTILAPANLAATASSNSQVSLTWTDTSNNEDGFEIERALFSSNPSFDVIATLSANLQMYSNTGLQPNTTYVYRIRAFIISGNGSSGYSNNAIVTTQP
ncbi:MAG: fibronectin type III domain-containing protein [Patescibacteria group bacterium]|nr:fibronectin type III domain-containing protein [Patescibacteria group bacterium]